MASVYVQPPVNATPPTQIKQSNADVIRSIQKQVSRTLGPAARGVFDFLLLERDANNQIEMSYTDLAAENGCCRMTVYRALRSLKSAGFISTEGGGPTSPNTITILSLPSNKGSNITSNTSGNTAKEVFPHTPFQEKLNAPPIVPPTGEDEFEKFYAAYPRKQAGEDARKAWGQVKPPLDVVLADIQRRLQTAEWEPKARKRFIPLPATYLRGKRWADEPTELPPPTDPVDIFAEYRRNNPRM